jgi:hypothetical protein
MMRLFTQLPQMTAKHMVCSYGYAATSTNRMLSQHRLIDAAGCSRRHLDVWVQRLDVCRDACDEAAATNRHKDGIQLRGVCYLQPAKNPAEQQHCLDQQSNLP